MISEHNMEFLNQNHRCYIIGTLRSLFKKFEQELLSANWQTIRHGLEVQSCPSPFGDNERFILYRSTTRREKEQPILDRYIQNIKAGIENINHSCDNGRVRNLGVVEHRIGRLLQQNSRAAALFDIKVQPDEHWKLKLTWLKYETREQAKQSIFEYIEVFYNRERLFSALDYRTPVEYATLKKVA